MNQFIFYNGEWLPANTPIVTATNRGLRYGDGLFETMKVMEGNIQLESLHMDRLFHGLATLQIHLPETLTATLVHEQVKQLCQKNKVANAARVRLSVFRGDGTLFNVTEVQPCLVIEAEPLAADYRQFHENGLHVDIYPDARKSVDAFANLKSNNYLPYLMAALFARENKLNDAFVLNTHDRICDATIANIFWVKDNIIHTPPLTEGCVAGVMRRYLLQEMSGAAKETVLTKETLLDAEEICLTNALFGVRWVKQFREKKYQNTVAKELYNTYIKK